MNITHLTLVFIAFFPIIASSQEPTLVSAVVRELKHDPNSPPLEWRNIPEKPSPIWTVEMDIEQVLRGDPNLKGKTMVTATADFQSAGNERYVTPRLNVGDKGIWAIKQYADGSWGEVYSIYEIEKGVTLPLIEGRHDAYVKVLQQLSVGAATPEPPHSGTEAPARIVPTIKTSVEQTRASNKAQESSPTEAQSSELTSSYRWIIIVVLIATVLGLLWFMLKRRS